MHIIIIIIIQRKYMCKGGVVEKGGMKMTLIQCHHLLLGSLATDKSYSSLSENDLTDVIYAII